MKKQSNSREITIFRSNSFLSAAQGKDIKDFFSASSRSIGAYFESASSRRIGTGLSFEEEKLLLPEILEVPAEHVEFRKKLADFYADMDTKVPYDNGLTLEIGLTNSNTDGVSSSNMPLKLMDYLRYRHAIKHPQVAMKKEDADGNNMKDFYIFDKAEVSKRSTKLRELQDQAMKAYQDTKGDDTKVKQALILLGVNPDQVLPEEHIDLLRNAAEKDPKKFLDIIQDKDLETLAWLKSMVDNNVLKVMHQKYFDTETDQMIGSNQEEAIYYFRDDLHSDHVGTLKARLQDKLLAVK